MGNGEIYIDCQPVGSSEETVNVVTSTSTYDFSIKDFFKNPIVILILGSLGFIIILFVINYFLNFMKPKKGGALTSDVPTFNFNQ
jgi:Na+-translocating ferredoxin:NAD+ oxidoreductase RnfA subunit